MSDSAIFRRNIMIANTLLAKISREFLSVRKIFTDMDDNDIIKYCHWYCEENSLDKEFSDFQKKLNHNIYIAVIWKNM